MQGFLVLGFTAQGRTDTGVQVRLYVSVERGGTFEGSTEGLSLANVTKALCMLSNTS